MYVATAAADARLVGCGLEGPLMPPAQRGHPHNARHSGRCARGRCRRPTPTRMRHTQECVVNEGGCCRNTTCVRAALASRDPIVVGAATSAMAAPPSNSVRGQRPLQRAAAPDWHAASMARTRRRPCVELRVPEHSAPHRLRAQAYVPTSHHTHNPVLRRNLRRRHRAQLRA